MRTRTMTVGVAVLATALAVPAAQTPAGQTPRPFRALFDGRTLDGWVVENGDARTFSIRDGVIHVEGTQGWLRSADQFGDFDLRVEVRFLTEDADSGIFLRAPGPASNIFIRGWPANAYQVQARDITKNKTTNPLWIANLYRHRVAAGETVFDADAVLAAARPTGEWQLFEIAVTGDRLTVQLNGALVTRAANLVNPRGFIGLQAEAGIVEYRTIAIREP